jgi:hypothetical protein
VTSRVANVRTGVGAVLGVVGTNYRVSVSVMGEPLAAFLFALEAEPRVPRERAQLE